MENHKITEKNLLTIMLISGIIVFIAIIAFFNLFKLGKQKNSSLKTTDTHKSQSYQYPGIPKEYQPAHSSEEYKKIMEKTKEDYEAFMEQNRDLNKF